MNATEFSKAQKKSSIYSTVQRAGKGNAGIDGGEAVDQFIKRDMVFCGHAQQPRGEQFCPKWFWDQRQLGWGVSASHIADALRLRRSAIDTRDSRINSECSILRFMCSCPLRMA